MAVVVAVVTWDDNGRSGAGGGAQLLVQKMSLKLKLPDEVVDFSVRRGRH
jgi:hypothetical protein